MTYAKHVTRAPGFDAGAAVRNSPELSAAWDRFPAFKRWVEATGDQDGVGLADVVEANADGLDGLKGHVDRLEARLEALEGASPVRPFP